MVQAFRQILRSAIRLAATACLVGAVGCGDPCKDLSEQVCGCMPTVNQQQNCSNHVNSLAGQYHANPNSAVEQAGLNRCTALLTTCSCDALATGNLAACGLAQE